MPDQARLIYRIGSVRLDRLAHALPFECKVDVLGVRAWGGHYYLRWSAPALPCGPPWRYAAYIAVLAAGLAGVVVAAVAGDLGMASVGMEDVRLR